jgi:hypothetical protein
MWRYLWHEGCSMTWALVYLWLSSGECEAHGHFTQHQYCINAKVKANPERVPDAMVCVHVKD